MSETETMEDYMNRIARAHGGDLDAAIAGVQQNFINAGPEQRAQWLEGWHQSLSLEYRPSRQHAEYLTLHRSLRDIDSVLKRAGR